MMEFEGPDKTTEYERQVKSMVDKQTRKTVTLKRQFEQHKSFIVVDNESVIPESFKGFHTLPELQSAQTTQEELNAYKLARLSDEEIELYIQFQETKDLNNIKQSNVQVEPRILQQKLQEIQLKLEIFNKSKEEGTDKSTFKDPFFYVAQLSNQIDKRIKLKRKKRPKCIKEDISSDFKESSETDIKAIDPSIYHAAVLIDEKDILSNRLSINEIKLIGRFQNYSPGSSSNVLYIKNLHPKIDIRELVALFSRFDSTESVKYRLLTGRMKGQAFVTFKDENLAKRAFALINGYKLRDRPMIIEYSKKKSD